MNLVENYQNQSPKKAGNDSFFCYLSKQSDEVCIIAFSFIGCCILFVGSLIANRKTGVDNESYDSSRI